MKKKITALSFILILLICGTTVLFGCRKPEEPVEIDRSFEYTTAETTTKEQEETTTESEPFTEETSTEPDSTTAPSAQKPTEEVTTEESAMTYFGDKNSIFSTLPLFEEGTFVEYFDKGFVEGIQFSGTTQGDFEAYVKAVLDAGKYTLNSQDGNRVYLAGADGTMCVTLLYKDGVMLVEAGKNYWDILTFAQEETAAPTKPAETTDSRYGYFDNQDMAFSKVPYFTYGTFTGYEAVDKGGRLTFDGVSGEELEAYVDTLNVSGFMQSGTTPSGATYYTSDKAIVMITSDNGTLVLQVTTY